MSAAQKTLILFFGALVALLAACVSLWYFLATPGVLFSLALFSFGMLLLREEGEKALKIILEAYFSRRSLALSGAKADIREILEAPVQFNLREEYEMQQEEIFGAFTDDATGTEKKKRRRRFLRRRARPLHRFLTVDVEITPSVTTIDGKPALWDALEVRFAKYEEPLTGQNPEETPIEEEGAEIIGWEVWHENDFRLETSAEMRGTKRILYYLHLHGPEIKKLQIRYLYEVLGAPFEVPLLPDAPKTALFHHAARKTAKSAVATSPAKEPEPITAKAPETPEKKEDVSKLPETPKKESKEAITPIPDKLGKDSPSGQALTPVKETTSDQKTATEKPGAVVKVPESAKNKEAEKQIAPVSEKSGKDTPSGQAVVDVKETTTAQKVTTEKSSTDVKVSQPVKDEKSEKQIATEKIVAIPPPEPIDEKQTDKIAATPPAASESDKEPKKSGAVASVAKTPSIPPVQKKAESVPAVTEKTLPDKKETPAPKAVEKPVVEKVSAEKPVETAQTTTDAEPKETKKPLVSPAKPEEKPALKQTPETLPHTPEKAVTTPSIVPAEKEAPAPKALSGTPKPEIPVSIQQEKSKETLPDSAPAPASKDQPVEKPVVAAPITAAPSTPLKEKLAQGFEKFKTIFGRIKKDTVSKTVHMAAVTSVKYKVAQTRYQAFTNNLEMKVKDFSTKLHERNMQKMESMKITIPPVKIADLKPSPAPANKEAKKKTVKIDENKELILPTEIILPKKQQPPASAPISLNTDPEGSESEVMDEDYEEFHYFVIRTGEEQEGPFEYDVVQSMFESGELRSEHLIWYPGLADWTPIYEIEEVIEEEPATSSPEQEAPPKG